MKTTVNKINSFNSLDVVIVIDKEKLPEDIRNKLPVDIQEKLIEILKEKENLYSESNSESKEHKQQMFAIQTGTVIGNIYDKSFKLEDIK